MTASLHPAAQPIKDLLADCTTRRGRRSGPGGQHRNKVETAIRIEHLPTGIKGEATERRSQRENHAAAVFRLRVKLALEVRRAPISKVPGPLWQSRCSGGRLAISPQHDDFPALLAEALDVLADQQMDVRAAAARLGCTVSQLTKFFKLQPRTMQQINDHRHQIGKGPLR